MPFRSTNVHEAEAARIVEDDTRAGGQVEDDVIVRAELAPRVVVAAGERAAAPSASTRKEPDMPRCMTSTLPSSRSARRYLARRPSAVTRRPLRRRAKAGGKGYAEVGAALLDPLDDGALHDRRKAAAHGFDFGQLGHGKCR